MNLCTIYKITNQVNGKVYIGQTWRSLSVRFTQHKVPSMLDKCVKLARAFVKYGKESFTIEALGASSSQVLADHLECHFISEYDSVRTGYNLRSGGARGRQSEESKAKQAAKMTGRTASSSTRARMAASQKGRKHSEATLAKMRLAARNRPPISEETRARLSESHKGLPVSEKALEGLAVGRSNKKGVPLSDAHRAKLCEAWTRRRTR